MASMPSRPTVQSTFPVGKRLPLPALQPAPSDKSNSAHPVYLVRLTNDVANALISNSDSTVRFSSSTNGVISIPKLHDIPFTARPVNYAHNDTARHMCLSRRGQSFRTVGPIVADLDIQQASRKRSIPPPPPPPSATLNNKRDAKSNDDLSNPSKRIRVRKPSQPTEKRPRTGTARQGLFSQPPPQPLQKLANNNSNNNNNNNNNNSNINNNNSNNNNNNNHTDNNNNNGNINNTKKFESQPVPRLSNPPLLPNPKPMSSSNTNPNSTSPPPPPPPPPTMTTPHTTSKLGMNGHHGPPGRDSLRSAPTTSIRSPASPNISPMGRSHAPNSKFPGLTSVPSNGSGPGNTGLSNSFTSRGLPNGNSNHGNSSGGSTSGSASGSGTPSGLQSSGISKRKSRNSFNGLRQHKVSPPSSLPHPTRRHVGSNRHISPMGSRGPSPPDNYYHNNANNYDGSPASPRVGTNIKAEQRADLRYHVIHVLAAGERTMDALKKRLRIEDGHEMQSILPIIIREVGERRSGVIHLRQSIWKEVVDDYREWADSERAKVKMARATMNDGRTSNNNDMNTDNNGDSGDRDNGGASSGSSTAGGTNEISMSEEALEEQLKAFEKEERSRKGGRVTIGSISDEASEMTLRKRFHKWYPMYEAIVRQMDEMRRGFTDLEKRFRESRTPHDRDTLLRRIQGNHTKFKDRRTRMEKCLPVVHALLKDIKQALNEHVARDSA